MQKMSLYLMLIIMELVVFGACGGDKTPATPEEFQYLMEQRSYRVVDISDQYEEGYAAYIAITSDKDYQIEYYRLPSADLAAQAFAINKDAFESRKADINTYIETSSSNAAKYALTSNDTYYYVAYIEDTLVYTTAPDNFQNEIKDVINDIGY